MRDQSTMTITGRLGATPELADTKSGYPITNLRVAVSEYKKAANGEDWDEETTWFSVVCFGDLAQNLCKGTIVAGQKVMVTGRMKSRQWETNAGEKATSWEITADDVGMCLSNQAISGVEKSYTPRGEQASNNAAATVVTAPMQTEELQPF